MEEKKNNEMKDEALESVTGGAACMYDIVTKKWYVYRKNNTLYGVYFKEIEAKKAYDVVLRQEEAEEEKKRSQWPIRPVDFPDI